MQSGGASIVNERGQKGDSLRYMALVDDASLHFA